MNYIIPRNSRCNDMIKKSLSWLNIRTPLILISYYFMYEFWEALAVSIANHSANESILSMAWDAWLTTF